MRTLALMLASAAVAAAQGNTVFAKVFSGVTTAQASAAVPNNGQAVHLLTVLIPGATSDVTDFVARLEASYDGSTWLPVSADLTTARTTGSFAYAVTRANGVYPAVRVRIVTPSASAITAYYSGALYPIPQFIFDTDRFLTSAAAPLVATWALCAGSPCVAGTNLTVQYLVTAAVSLKRCYIAAKTAPASLALIVDIRKNGGASVFGAGKLQLAAAATYATTDTFSGAALAEGDRLTINIDQVGTGTAGQDVTVACRMQ